MRKSLFILALAALSFGLISPAWATNGVQLMGIGPYQKSMGGAVTAAPNDGSTMVSNPAGIAFIGARADFLFDAFMPTRSIDYTAMGGEDSEGGSPLYGIPGFSIVAPISDDLTFGLGAFMVAGMGVDYDTINIAPFDAVMTQLMGGTPDADSMTMYQANLYSQMLMWKFTPTISKKVNDQLTVGVSLNVDYQQMAIKMRFSKPGTADGLGLDLSRAVGALGAGVTVGAIYKVNDMVQVGFMYATEQSFADLDYRLSAGDIVFFPDAMGNMLVNGDGSYKLGMNFPQQMAFGIAITPNDRLKITADVKWINYSSTYDEVELSGDFNVVNAMTGPTGETASSLILPFGWEDVTIISVGAEYKLNPMVTLRAGYTHGNSPIGEEDVLMNSMMPAITEDHFGLGAEFSMGDNWGIGVAFMKAFKNEVEGSQDLTMLGQTLDSGAKLSLEETSLLFSLAYKFGG